MSFLKSLIKGSIPTTTQTPEAPAAKETVFTVDADMVFTSQSQADKASVLGFIAEKMQTLGLVTGDYLPALQQREQKISTYLINGVAIPHGVNEAKDQVQQTGVIILQLPNGILWNADSTEKTHFVVGIAAKGNDHISVLQRLTEVVMDAPLAAHLGQHASKAEILNALNGDRIQQPAQEITDLPINQKTTVVDKAGMHARPASLISEMADTFASTTIQIRNGERIANAKSMAALLSMGAVEGDSLVVSAEGELATQAVERIATAIQAGLDKPVDGEDKADYKALAGLEGLINPICRRSFKGAAASPGIALAPVFKLKPKTGKGITELAADACAEQTKLTSALATAGEQLTELYDQLMTKTPSEAVILKAQKQLLKDDAILTVVTSLITEGKTAAWACKQAFQEQIDNLNKLEDERLRARSADMADVCGRLVSILLDQSQAPQFPTTDFILLARELTPSQTAHLDQLKVRAIVTELGGPNSHMAILARALGIPAIVGVGEGLLEESQDAELAIVDPQTSQLYLDPDQPTQQQTLQRQQQWTALQEQEDQCKFEPAITLDGHKIIVACNIANASEASLILEQGGEGAGLLRSEFLFEAAPQEPSVAEQSAELKQITDTLAQRQLVVRTSDIGGDKPVSWLDMPHEDNPFLGIRGIRLSFKHEDVFRRQLEAIFSVAKQQVEATGKTGIHIMFPMISRLSDWQQARDIAESVRTELNAPVLPLGIMVEVPSVVFIAEHLAREVDFFSIGSNDLTQYTLAMDRLHPDLCKESDSYHPSLLQMIDLTVKAANAHGKWVGLCGNMAADPNVAALLVGLGVHELSVSPANVAAVKHLIRSVSYEKLVAKAQKALAMGSSEEVMALYQTHHDLV